MKRISVCRPQCLTNAKPLVFFRIGLTATARSTNTAKRQRQENAYFSSRIGRGRRKKRRDHEMRANKLPVPTEAQEQMTLFSWAAMQSGKYPELKLLYHVPNGGSRHKAEAGRLRAGGRKSWRSRSMLACSARRFPRALYRVEAATRRKIKRSSSRMDGSAYATGLLRRFVRRLGKSGGNNHAIFRG